MMPKAIVFDRDGTATIRTWYGALVVNEPAIACEKCHGTGTIEYDEPIPDYHNGGYLRCTEGECFECGGYGYVPAPEDEEE
jgi:hypothetical protein